ncbi:hypothetical protein IQ02_01122 [Flavobacterium glaciei]|uniref:Uncharacterized protein n=1 Tax=Flavobacterium glaciei TaxID=386300 RepID=A0A562PXI7_9FLAO|nr:hypothetical protein DFR66_104129 [Flavobacterium glaciei]TWI49135.1 hypothetical protein IQ02_01122 [Flavobacterium glaciei]
MYFGNLRKSKSNYKDDYISSESPEVSVEILSLYGTEQSHLERLLCSS